MWRRRLAVSPNPSNYLRRGPGGMLPPGPLLLIHLVHRPSSASGTSPTPSSQRDAAMALGVSHQRIHQLSRPESAESGPAVAEAAQHAT